MLGIRMILKALGDILTLADIDPTTRLLFTGKGINTTVSGTTYPTRNAVLDRIPVGKRHIYPPQAKSITQVVRSSVVRQSDVET